MTGGSNAKQALDWGTQQLAFVSPSSRLDAMLLLGFVLGCSKEQLITRDDAPISAHHWKHFSELIARRVAREPIAYLVGSQEFWGLPFKVTADVLIPRPETELLVELALAALADMPGPHVPRVLDLGTGSGCIAVSIAHTLRARGIEGRVVAVERSEAAVEVARQNVQNLGVNNVVELQLSDWREFRSDLQFDVVVSNPPYIAQDDSNRSPETEFEPKAALFAGTVGLDAIVSIVALLPQFLTPTGQAFIEIGAEQGSAARGLAAESVHCVDIRKDLSGRDRVAVFRR